MNIFVTGTNFINKGAELMLGAIISATRQWDASYQVALDLSCGSFAERKGVGARHFAWRAVRGRLGPARGLGVLAQAAPLYLRKRLDFVCTKDIDAVFDASGLLFSAQSDPRYTIDRWRLLQYFARKGKPIILLPQVFGPFDSPAQREAVLQIIDHASLVFARDRVSLEHLVELCGERENIKIAPDFTNLLQVSLPEKYQFVRRHVLIVPNVKMLTHAGEQTARNYIPFIIDVINSLKRHGEKPLLLVHSAKKDGQVATSINSRLSDPLPVISESDALAIKAIIGNSRGVVSSRFHAVVSSLCHGRPCLVTAWSHKYRELLNDYNAGQWLVELESNMQNVDERVASIWGAKNFANNCERLAKAGEIERDRARAMWTEVYMVLNAKR